MAFVRVQATGKVSGDNVTAITLTFATPPTVGNGIVVPVTLWRTGTNFVSCTDNRGNSYTLAHNQLYSVTRAAVYFCPKVVTSAAPFTITLTASAANCFLLGAAIEVSGGGSLGLAVDRATGNGNFTLLPTTGATAPLTADDVLLVAVVGAPATQASITVEVVSPPWTQEFEELSATHHPGEGNTRVRTGVLGTTQSCSWTLSTTNAQWAAAIVAFKAAPVTVTERVETFVWGPV